MSEHEPPAPPPAGQWLDQVRQAERRGDLLGAYDLCTQGLAHHPDDLPLKHRAALALLRSGATGAAAAFLDREGLRGHPDEDIAALEARLAKDEALALPPGPRRQRALEAAERYLAIHRHTGGTYSAINGATLLLLGGQPERAAELARSTLAALAPMERTGIARDYYESATRAEAALLLGDTVLASRELQEARQHSGADHAALASTRRQLRLICREQGLDLAVLEPLRAPSVITYTGHMIAPAGTRGRFPAREERRVAAAIAEMLERRRVGFGFGSLACGGDILVAEALLERGSELHVVLPFDAEDFCETSVRRGGAGWLERFGRCLQAARSITRVTTDRHCGDDLLFDQASRLGMGLSLLRARFLDAEVLQLAIWDGQPPAGLAGTAVDVSSWTARGLPVEIIDPGPAASEGQAGVPASTEPGTRTVRALLFGDVKGFSKLTDSQVPVFFREVLGAFAGVLDPEREHIDISDTWGDGLYIVFRDPEVAARCALGLQDAMAALDLAALGLPPTLALRIGVHVGPVHPCYDPIMRRVGFSGAQVTRTARIEPVTPPGEVYVTEEMAAELTLRGERLACEYVGLQPSAKGYGPMRMYRLRRAPAGG